MKSPIRKLILIALLLVGGLVTGWVIIIDSRKPARPLAAAVVQKEETMSSTFPVPTKPSDWTDDIESRIYNVIAELHDATVHVEAVHCGGPECGVTLKTEDVLTGKRRLQLVINALLESPSIGAGSVIMKGAEPASPGSLQQDIVLFSRSVNFSM